MREVRIGTPSRPHSANEPGVTTLRQIGRVRALVDARAQRGQAHLEELALVD